MKRRHGGFCGVLRGGRAPARSVVIDNGFYLAVGCLRRATISMGVHQSPTERWPAFTLFHILSAAVVVYACAMIASAAQGNPSHDRAVA